MLLNSISMLTNIEIESLLKRQDELQEVMPSVTLILNDIKENGDTALLKYTMQFDKAALKDIEVSHKEIHEAVFSLDKKLLTHLKKAASNIRAFHDAQATKDWIKEFAPGIRLGQRISPLGSVGAYVPGGRASYPSTALMTVIPAKVAGVRQVIVCTPPNPDGTVNPLTLAAAHIAGADRVFRAGGVQAIAAMAYGTKTIPKVDKIVGPGNVYVTAAKMACGTAIDFPAGPSEVLIIADGSARADFIASDMIAQAEHDPNAVCVLVTPSENLAKQVMQEIEIQIKNVARAEIIKTSLENAAILTGTLDECIDFSNKFAPEHLEIMTEEDILGRIRHAGSIFVGSYAPVSAGDYASGTNHVLPTAGYARMFSGLNIDHFVTKSSVQIIEKKGLEGMNDTIIGLAEAEGLFAHANAVRIRKS
ncbi:MAG: histidinol dehydrogenase [Candidatus Methanoperedens sp.]|nr:histidinol dehydrogenase [Candidatus Methanoperedens sp. BLZ2]KAB2948420.1 MAG: histidinol dehydrogenase [Candidatus Methanoperedens sp.]MBZ0174489.1 histidinol dehydrogenase [Candidatus Methanoperedens nitroreducens]MCX9078512.1 histidinol dehydrogenase [Candidatus Methanoperedens sp.]